MSAAAHGNETQRETSALNTRLHVDKASVSFSFSLCRIMFTGFEIKESLLKDFVFICSQCERCSMMQAGSFSSQGFHCLLKFIRGKQSSQQNDVFLLCLKRNSKIRRSLLMSKMTE